MAKVRGPAPETPGTATEATGGVHLALNGSIGVSGSLATIAIQNLFDPTQNFLVQCNEKDHTLNGEPFCDELTVLPPGIYEVIVQSPDPACHAGAALVQDHRPAERDGRASGQPGVR